MLPIIAVIAIVAIIIALIVGMMSSYLTSNSYILKRCYGMTFFVACILLLFPPFIPIASLLLIIAGIMLVMGKCNPHSPKVS